MAVTDFNHLTGRDRTWVAGRLAVPGEGRFVAAG